MDWICKIEGFGKEDLKVMVLNPNRQDILSSLGLYTQLLPRSNTYPYALSTIGGGLLWKPVLPQYHVSPHAGHQN